MSQFGPLPPREGSIEATAKLLLLWGSENVGGFCRVGMVDERARQRVVAKVKAGVEAAGIPFHEIELPEPAVPPGEAALDLVERLRALPQGVVSLHGFTEVNPLNPGLNPFLQALNFQREQLAVPGLRQIWWMPIHIAEQFSTQIPDLDSWFQIRLSLTEAVSPAEEPRVSLDSEAVPQPEPTQILQQMPRESGMSPDQARARLAEIHGRVQQAAQKDQLDLEWARQSFDAALEDLTRAGAWAEAEKERDRLRTMFPEVWTRFDVFLCYNSRDKAEVETIAKRLEKLGLKTFFAKRDLKPGRKWQEELERRIGTLPSAAVLVGQGGLGPWQEIEIQALLQRAVKRGVGVIPVILPGCIETPMLTPFLASFAWADLREPGGLEKLYWGITGRKLEIEPQAMPPNNLPYGPLGTLLKGRQPLLVELREDPSSPGARARPRAICGLGGIGKTRLAVEFAWRHAADFGLILFIRAESVAELRGQLARLASQGPLGLGLNPSLPEARAIDLVLRALQERKDWLLILDNVDELEVQAEARQILPALVGGQVLITTRLQHWPSEVQCVQVDHLSIEAGRDYLLEATQGYRQPGPNDPILAEDLAKRIDGLPVALELTASYIKVRSAGFDELLEAWEQESSEILEWQDAATSHYRLPLTLAWKRSFDQLSQPARILLGLAAFFSSDPIPLAIFTHGKLILDENSRSLGFDGQGPIHLQGALTELTRYSLITRNRLTPVESIQIHSLVQMVTRKGITAEQQRSYIEISARLLQAFLPPDPDRTAAWQIWELLEPHILQLANLAIEQGVFHPTALLLNELGLFLAGKANFWLAEACFLSALALETATLGPLHPNVARSMGNFATMLKRANRLSEAESYLRLALQSMEQSLGTAHPRLTPLLLNLGHLLLEKGNEGENFDQAEELLRRACKIDEHALGPEHPDRARDLSILAGALSIRDERLPEALELAGEAVRLAEANGSAIALADRLHNRASILRRTQNHSAAEADSRRALQIIEAHYPPNHHRVAHALTNLGVILYEADKHTESVPLFERALRIDRAILGPRDQDVGVCLLNLGAAQYHSELLPQAEASFLEAVEILEATKGPEHETSQIARQHLETTRRLRATIDNPRGT